MPETKARWKTKSSWRAKLQKPMRPKLVPISDAMVRKIPPGEVTTLAEIRRRLALWHRVEVACPLVTGIFLRIVAEASEEDQLAGREEVTPYWRVVGEGGRLNPKFPGGVDAQAFRLIQEGHTIEGDRVVLGKKSAA